MTPRQFLDRLHEHFECEDDELLTVPQLIHFKGAFEHMYWDAYYDLKTPCPHEGTRWRLEDGCDRCGMCGRKIEKEKAA